MKKGASEMAEVQQSSRMVQSHIPIVVPRQSALSSPNLGLVSPSRHLSVSGSPTHPSPGSTSSSTSGGLTPFRSFRNLLSFGSSKQTHSATSSSMSKSPFSGLGSIRRSIHGERSVSAPHLRRERSHEDSPVLTIELPHEPFMKGMEFETGVDLDTRPQGPTCSNSASTTSFHHIEDGASLSDPAVGPTDLSTILEAETSGLSKHIPVLDNPQENTGSEAESVEARANANVSSSLNSSLLHPDPRRQKSDGGYRTPPSHESSALDLSASKVTNEVLEAMSETSRKEEWLHGIVVDDASDNRSDSVKENAGSDADGDPNMSFNLSALDPDLAALLSPNRLTGREPAVLAVTDSKHSLSIPLPVGSDKGPPSVAPLSNLRGESLRRSASSFTPSSPPSPLGSHSSPVSRAAPLPKVSAATPNLPSSSSLPRLTRSVSDRPAPQRLAKPPPPPPLSSQIPLARAMSHSPERPTSAASRSPRLGPSPLAHGDQRRPHAGDESDTRRPALSRLMTPSRLRSHLTPGSSSRPIFRRQNTTPPSTWDGDSISPSSRPSSSSGIAPSRLQQPRPSLDGGIGTAGQKSSRLRSRDRSSSVVEYGTPLKSSPYQPSNSRLGADWLGPRTQKAFAAAGLLDLDKDGSGSGSGSTSRRTQSRFGSSRSSIEQDSRARLIPSRMAFSDAGSSSSWVRCSGSISRTVTMSEAGGPRSESASTPRTVFSSSSTAPTSVSAASNLQSELQNLQERHSIETGALLSALADSQRTTKLLREENTQLRDRLQDTEDRLADTLDRLHRLQYALPSQLAPTAIRANPQRFSMSGSADHLNGLGIAHSRLQSFLRPGPEPSFDLPSSPEPTNPSPETPIDIETFTDNLHKRVSMSSSVFPGPPSNMSMIMHEEGITAEHSATFSSRATSPSSPTLVFGKLNGKQSTGSRHARTQSVSSAGNISPTTASVSMITGSPGSLYLRPEHERHLGDMPSLDLCAEELDDDDYDQ
ncbi:hypothetical protein AcW1_001988 [Taiwanofungus camphoratus]|nr:hypothetical protein AcW1_001988 [Antrodia cinnamomea]